MHSFHNIEPSGFHKGQYVGYAAGKVWHIRKTNSTYGNWIAQARKPNSPEADPAVSNVYAFRLSDLSDKLAKLPATSLPHSPK